MSDEDKNQKESDEHKRMERKERGFILGAAGIFLSILFVNAVKHEPWKDETDAPLQKEVPQQMELKEKIQPE